MKSLQKSKSLLFITLVFILTLSLLLGSRMILAGDFNFLYDQARDLLLTKNIAVDHDLTLIGSRSGIGGFFHGPLYLYLLVPFFLLGQGNPFTFVALHLMIGIVTILAGYIVGKKLYNEFAGILVAFFLGISPRIWGYYSATQGINLIPLTYLGLFYCLVLYLRGKRKMFIWVAFFTGIAFQFETASSFILVPIVIATYFLLPSAHKHWKIIIGSIGAFVLSLISFVLFDLRHQFLMTKSVITYLNQGERGAGHLPFLQRITSHTTSLLGTYQALLVQNTLILQILFGLLILYIFRIILDRNTKKHLKRELLLFVLFPVATFALLLFYPKYVYGEYVLGLIIPIALFVGIGSTMLWKEKVGKLLIGVFLLLQIGLALSMSVPQYLTDYKNTTPGSYKNQKAVVDWIFKDANGKKFGYFVYTPEVFTVGMDYLFWWEGTKIYHNPTDDIKEKITYLVLYPPLEGDNEAHTFWKKSAIRTKGIILQTKLFPGRIIVEKLDIPSDDPDPDPNYYQNLIFR